MITTFSAVLVYPLIWYILTEEFETTLPIMLPFVDETTTKGYAICLVIQSLWVVIAMLGTISSDLAYTMLALYSWPLIDLLCAHLDEMNMALVTNRKFGESKEMKMFFINQIRLHYDITT